MRILGIDPGIRYTGIAIVDTDEPKLLASKTIRDGTPGALLEFLSKPDLIVIEYPVAFAKAAGMMIDVAFNAGLWTQFFCTLFPGIEFEKSKASRNGWRKFYGRDFDERYAFEKLFGDSEGISSHERDAALMAYAAGKDFKKQ